MIFSAASIITTDNNGKTYCMIFGRNITDSIVPLYIIGGIHVQSLVKFQTFPWLS